MVIQGSWCYTRESWAASILSGEPAVPGKIPDGVARDLIPGSSGSTLSGVPTVPGKIPGGYSVSSYTSGAAIRGGVVDLLVYTRAGRWFVYNRGWILFIPAAMGRWAFRWLVNARWAIATAFAWLSPCGPWSWRWQSLWQAGLGYLQHSGRPGLAVSGGSFRQGGFYRDPCVWTGGAGQQGVNDPRPLSCSVPSLSLGTSHWAPRRQSREGLVQGCSREGEERPNPELLTLEWVAVESWLGSAWAGL